MHLTPLTGRHDVPFEGRTSKQVDVVDEFARNLEDDGYLVDTAETSVWWNKTRFKTLVNAHLALGFGPLYLGLKGNHMA